MQFALANVALTAIDLLWYVVIAAAIMSWMLAFNVINYHNEFVRSLWNGLNAVTEPMLRPIRKVLPNLGGVDISPVILLLFFVFLRSLIIYYLR